MKNLIKIKQIPLLSYKTWLENVLNKASYDKVRILVKLSFIKKILKSNDPSWTQAAGVCVSHLPGLPQDSEEGNRQDDSAGQAHLSPPLHPQSQEEAGDRQGGAWGHPFKLSST